MSRKVKSTAAAFVALGLTLVGSGNDSEKGVGASPSTMTEPAGAPSGSLGGYQPVSDVAQHAKVSADVCDINALLDANPIDFAAVGTTAPAEGSRELQVCKCNILDVPAFLERAERRWNTPVSS